jgi:membrane dipeptidase
VYQIDGLQYCNWSRTIFEQMHEARMDAVHVTICYHETFRETAGNIATWNRLLEDHADLIMPGRSADDVKAARASSRTAIFFGLQNCSAIEDDIGLVEVLYDLGVRFMQLTYNNQSLLGSGCYEPVEWRKNPNGKVVKPRY